MRKYYILVESGADLSPELIETYDIRVAPMHLSLDDKDYLDGEISVEDACAFYDQTGRIPKTSAVSPFEFIEVIEQIKKENPEAIIVHIGYSAKLTSSFQNSLIAGEGFDSVYHIDTSNVSIGQGYVVIKAADLIERNPDIAIEELISKVEEFAQKTKFWFVPGNLKYLRAGGRVSNVKTLLASLLHIKPLLELIDGKMYATKNYRGSINNVALKVISDFFKWNKLDKETLFLGYTHSIEPELKEKMDEHARSFGVKNVIWFKAGAVITSHAGPGGVGIAGIDL